MMGCFDPHVILFQFFFLIDRKSIIVFTLILCVVYQYDANKIEKWKSVTRWFLFLFLVSDWCYLFYNFDFILHLLLRNQCSKLTTALTSLSPPPNEQKINKVAWMELLMLRFIGWIQSTFSDVSSFNKIFIYYLNVHFCSCSHERSVVISINVLIKTKCRFIEA